MILGIFLLSVFSLIAYLIMHSAPKSFSSKNNVRDTSIVIQGNRNAIVTENQGTIVTGDHANINQGPPEYDGDFANKPFEEFVRENDGRTVFINIDIPNVPFSKDIVDNFDYQDHNRIPTYVTKFGYGRTGDINLLEFAVLWPCDPKIYWKDASQDELNDDHIYYAGPLEGILTVKFIVNNLNIGFITEKFHDIYIKGQYRVNYQLGGQGQNFVTLSPI
ncbi:hypothetical protein [Dinghuibacter silviterrae]|nr:hypothetical protein [Dinghuibacter silviterrae]